MFKKIIVFSSLVCIILLVYNTLNKKPDNSSTDNNILNIAGSTSLLPIMQEAINLFKKNYPQYIINIAGGDSLLGIQQLAVGAINIANTGYLPREEDVKKHNLRSFPIAIDGVAVVVDIRNSVQNLTTQQLVDIFSGKITNWKEINGTDAEIILYTREEGSATRECFIENAIKNGKIASSANVITSSRAMKSAIFQNPNAIAYMSIAYVDEDVKALAIDGIIPSQENLQNAIYPIIRQLCMNTRGNPEGLTKMFIDFILASENSHIIKDNDYIAISK